MRRKKNSLTKTNPTSCCSNATIRYIFEIRAVEKYSRCNPPLALLVRLHLLHAGSIVVLQSRVKCSSLLQLNSTMDKYKNNSYCSLGNDMLCNITEKPESGKTINSKCKWYCDDYKESW